MMLLNTQEASSVSSRGLPFMCTRGFTLMEVLVATAITGMALGVILSLLAQGHRQAYRGDISRMAAEASVNLLDRWQSKGKFPSSEQGDIEDFSGWTYSIESRPLVTHVTLPSGQTRQVEPEELVEIDLTLNPPGNAKKFKLAFWIPRSSVE